MVAQHEADDGETARAPARGRQCVGGDIPNGVQGAREGKLSDCHSRVLELGLMCHRHQKATGQQSTTMARRGANGATRAYCKLSQNGLSQNGYGCATMCLGCCSYHRPRVKMKAWAPPRVVAVVLVGVPPGCGRCPPWLRTLCAVVFFVVPLCGGRCPPGLRT